MTGSMNAAAAAARPPHAVAATKRSSAPRPGRGAAGGARRDGLDLRCARPRAGRGRALAARRAAGRQQRDGRLCGARRRRRRAPAPCCRSASASRPAASARRSQPGTAARIFTGAQMPRRRRRGGDAGAVRAPVERRRAHRCACRAPGQWIRRRGEDVGAAPSSCAAGTRLTPQALGLAASVGAATPAGRARGRASRCSPPATSWRCRASRSSPARSTTRTASRCAACSRRSAATSRRPRHRARPARGDARGAARARPRGNDLIVTCGGVSVGEEDHLKPAVRPKGALDLWQIAMKPGKPLAFGEVLRGDGSSAWFIGLPGNPVSSFVTFLLAVRPFLLRLQGATRLAPRPIAMRADFDWPQARPPARVPARAPQRAGRARPVRQPELGRADLDGLGRRPGRQPGRAGDRARRHGALPAASRSCSR